jgi:hypothetical protein
MCCGELVRVLGRQPSKRVAAILGRLIARLWTLRQMSTARRRHDAGRQVAGHRGGAGEGPRHDLPAGPAGDRAHVLAESDATDEDDLADFLDSPSTPR